MTRFTFRHIRQMTITGMVIGALGAFGVPAVLSTALAQDQAPPADAPAKPPRPKNNGWGGGEWRRPPGGPAGVRGARRPGMRGERAQQTGDAMNMPDRRQELERLRREDPEGFKMAQEARELEKKSQQLSAELRRTTNPEEKKRLEKELREAITKEFEVRTQLKERVLKDLEQRLDRARKDVEMRKKSRDKIIEEHYQRITGQTSYMNW